MDRIFDVSNAVSIQSEFFDRSENTVGTELLRHQVDGNAVFVDRTTDVDDIPEQLSLQNQIAGDAGRPSTGCLGGFASQTAQFDHPVRLSLWLRVARRWRDALRCRQSGLASRRLFVGRIQFKNRRPEMLAFAVVFKVWTGAVRVDDVACLRVKDYLDVIATTAAVFNNRDDHVIGSHLNRDETQCEVIFAS